MSLYKLCMSLYKLYLLYNRNISWVASEICRNPEGKQKNSFPRAKLEGNYFSAFPRDFDRFHSSRIVVLLLLHDSRNFINKIFVIFDPFSWPFFNNCRWFGLQRKNLGLFFVPRYFIFFIDYFVKSMKIYCEYSLHTVNYQKQIIRKKYMPINRRLKKKIFYRKKLKGCIWKLTLS